MNKSILAYTLGMFPETFLTHLQLEALELVGEKVEEKPTYRDLKILVQAANQKRNLFSLAFEKKSYYLFVKFFPIFYTSHNFLLLKSCEKTIFWDNENNCKIISFLLQKGANTECKDIYGQTPLCKAILCNNAEAVKVLISNGANCNLKFLSIPLIFLACGRNNLEIVTNLVRGNTNLNIIFRGMTVLEYSRINSDKEIINFLEKNSH